MSLFVSDPKHINIYKHYKSYGDDDSLIVYGTSTLMLMLFSFQIQKNKNKKAFLSVNEKKVQSQY